MGQNDYDAARLTVRLGAIKENYRRCRQFAGDAAVAGAVKANGYGLGAFESTRALIEAGCDTFFVARLQEGIALRPVAPGVRIFVLDGVRDEAVPALIANNLTPVLNSLEQIACWSRAAPGRDAVIHFDTGISRLGLPPADLSTFAAEANTRLAGINVVLVMSHLACSEDHASPMNGEQLSRFRAGLAMLPPAPASLSASAGLLLGRDYVFDLARPGLALFGGNPCSVGRNPFCVAARLTGRIIQLRRVDKGESVGYGATFRVERPMLLATVAAGYADGLKRALGNKGAGAIAGLKAPVVGRMSMDLVTLDVTHIPSEAVYPGAEVELLGDTIHLDDVAKAAQTASYDILASLGSRIERHYVSEGAP